MQFSFATAKQSRWHHEELPVTSPIDSPSTHILPSMIHRMKAKLKAAKESDHPEYTLLVRGRVHAPAADLVFSMVSVLPVDCKFAA
jgi:hypothetical protein